MRDGIVFKVDREIGAGTFVVNAYRFGMFTGALRGHLDNRSGVIRLYPHAGCQSTTRGYPGETIRPKKLLS